MQLNEKGQGIMEVLVAVPITILGLVVMFILLNPIGQLLFNQLDTANSAIIGNISAIKLIVSVIGLIVVIMVVVHIIKSFSQPQYPQGGYQ